MPGPRPSAGFFTSRNAILTGGIVAGGYFLAHFLEDYKTPGVRNIEERWTARGGHPGGTSATATPLGDTQRTVADGQSSPERTPNTPRFQEEIASQSHEPSTLDKKFNKTVLNAEGGKGGGQGSRS